VSAGNAANVLSSQTETKKYTTIPSVDGRSKAHVFTQEQIKTKERRLPTRTTHGTAS